MTYSTTWLIRKVGFVSVTIFLSLSPTCPYLAQAWGPTFTDPGNPGMSTRRTGPTDYTTGTVLVPETQSQ
jgi:hypothetical protein